MKTEKLHSKILKSRQRYDESIGELEKDLAGKIGFDFAIDYQPSDGHMVLDIESGMKIAPLSLCLGVIKEKGFLSREDHGNLCI